MADSNHKRQRKPRHIFYDPDGNKLTMGVIKKYWRDIYVDHLGFKTEGIDHAITVDLDNPLGEYQLQPGPTSPICAKCGMNECGGRNLYMPYGGAEKPEVTIVLDAVSKKEDVLGEIGSEGPSAFIKDIIEEHGYPLDKIRWAPMTICPPENPRDINFKTKGRWCRSFLVQDLLENTPNLIIPIGSTALGWLSHKSNAQDWGGKLLTYRGWPDDWLSTPEFMLPRPSPIKGEHLVGHPLFGPAPEGVRIPMIPLQSPRIVWMTQNRHLITQWKNQLKWALDMAGKHVPAPVYDKPWWKVTTDPDEIVAAMEEIAENPQVVAFDVETNGLKAWGEGAKLVIMMFRWKAPDGSPRAIGFPWDYPESPLINHIQRLSPVILEAMYKSKLCGHNVSFDIGWVAANVPGADLNRLNDAMWYDTWHMAYVRRQGKGTLGLEMMAYEYAQDLAGYEEDMVMLIDLLEDDLHPGAGKGGHYAKCPKDKWDSHLKPYIMGDVEVCYGAHKAITEELESSRQYSIPLAHQTRRGSFRWFKAPKRDWVYNEIVSPAAAMLSKMMCRGMHVNIDELERQEDLFPKKIRETINALRESHPRIMDWCAQMEATDPDWEFDLEKKDKVLKPMMFDVLGLPVHRLTEAGKKKYGDKPEDIESLTRELQVKFAATDKFSLNKLAVDHEEIRPLLEYRKIHKQYGTYVRSMRNLFTPGLDKKERTKDPHLNRDGYVHATFKLTGTRGGRLSCCIPTSSLVSTSRGIIQLGEVAKGDRIQTPTGPKTVLDVWDRVRKPTLTLTFDNGRTLSGSPDHKVVVGGELKPLSDVRVGDKFEECVAIGPDVDHLYAFRETPVKFARGGRKNSLRLPRELNEDLAFLLGHFAAEGNIEHHPVRRSSNSGRGGNGTKRYPSRRRYSRAEHTGKKVPVRISISFGWDEDPLRDHVKRGWEQATGVHFSKHRLATGLTLSVASRDIAEWMCSIGAGGLARQKRVPRGVFESPIGVRMSFLQGLFEGDGTASNRTPQLTTYSSVLAEGVSALLDSVGVRFSVKKPYVNFEGRGRRRRFVITVHAESRKFLTENYPIFWSSRKLGAVRVTDSHLSKIARKDTCVVKGIKRGPEQEMVDIHVDSDEHLFCVNKFAVKNSDPNLQQLPRDGLIKRLYDSRYGKRGVLYQADLSQIELRLMAAACGDRAMVQAYLDDVDLHSLTQSKITDRTYEECCKEHLEWLQKNGREDEAKKIELERKIAKTVNFLTGYGGGAFGLQTSLAQQGIYKQIEECEEILESFFDGYPSLRKYLSHYKAFIQEHGVAVSILGRVRIFEEVFGDNNEAKNKALRAGCNHLIQSTASDMMLLALTTIENVMRAENLESQLISTVHDSALIDVVREELPIVHEIVIEVLDNLPTVMKAAYGDDYDTSWMIVPISGDAEIGPNYLDMLKLPSYGEIDFDEYYHKIDAAA